MKQQSSYLQKRILIVDDDPFVRKSLKKALESEGYLSVDEAEDGDDAIVLSNAINPALVVMDNQMKRLNGREATSRIKEQNPDTKVVIMTGMPRPSLVKDCLEAGAVNFVIKPVGIPRFLTMVKNQVK